MLTVWLTAYWGTRQTSTLRGVIFFFSSRRRHTRLQGDWSSDVCSSDLADGPSITRCVPPLARTGGSFVEPDRPRIISPDTLRGSARDRTPPAQALTTKDRKSVV